MVDQNCDTHKQSKSDTLQNTITAAAQLLHAVSYRGVSYTSQLHQFGLQHEASALLQQTCYGTMRWWVRLTVLLEKLLHKPCKKLEPKIKCLLLASLYQLFDMRLPHHAVVQAAVEACRDMNCHWAHGIVNAVLREYIRNKNELENSLRTNESWCYSHPDWLLQMLQQQYPDDWRDVVTSANKQPPMHLRVNTRLTSLDEWRRMAAANGLHTEPVSFCPQAVQLLPPTTISEIPGFAEGMVSVQDGAAQQAVPLLDAATEDTVLDACAAPGGKVAHLLEQTSFINKPVCLDRSSKRIQYLRQTLQRLNLIDNVVIKRGDAMQPESWWDGRYFTRIMLDVPCSATGVIRRNPDIKLRPDDGLLSMLCANQQRILRTLWQLLAPGGKLIYITCSILEQENDAQADTFLRHTANAVNCTPDTIWGQRRKHGIQILPGYCDMDGFYYLCLQKKPLRHE